MEKNKILISAALAGILAASTSGVALADKPAAKEKCYGIAKAGKNDCGDKKGTHSCAGQALQDNDPNEWMYVDKGTCEQAGGTLANADMSKNDCKGKNACNK